MDAYQHNRAVFDDVRVAADYERQQRTGVGFLDLGEQTAILAAAPRARDSEILDVGVGAGRTTPLLRLISDDYVAVDCSPRMADAFRRHHAGVDCRVADARDLSDFADGSFGLVVFSNNGIDTVDHTERIGVLAELGRVTADNGLVVFSTLNRDGPSFGESPFQLRRPTTSGPWPTRELVIRVGRGLLNPRGSVIAVRNWLRYRGQVHDHGTWAMGPLAAHDFAPFTHFTTVVDLRETVTGAGLVSLAVYDEHGRTVDLRGGPCGADNFTVIARRR